MSDHSRRRKRRLAASTLAQMGVCERRVLLEQRYGRRNAPQLEVARQHGLQRHAAFLQEGRAQPEGAKPWCMVASLVFGPDAAETRALRRFRDEVLKPLPAGRAFILFYYRRSPGWCNWLVRRRWALTAVRRVLRATVQLLEWAGRNR